ncbi:hypothetical protein HDU98_011711 [Podochytrium sp. JEL0797]|nr:hypothetical protein HDU98_011711 [Podochytrium sp. JEL0797]
MTRKTANQNASGNATVSGIQQSHTANVQAAKNVASPKPQMAAAKSPSKPSTPAPKSNVAAAMTSKPATPQAQKVQAAPMMKPASPQKTQVVPAKAQTTSKPSTPQKMSHASPIMSQPIQRAASAKKFDLGIRYEVFCQPKWFQEPESWTKNQTICYVRRAPAAPKQLNKQPSFKAATPVASKPATPAPKAQPNVKGAKVAPATSIKGKSAVKLNSRNQRQLILRPKLELVVYTPLWIQVYHWAYLKQHPEVAQRFKKQQQSRGRSADKFNRNQRLEQQKQRVVDQRKPNDRQQPVTPKQQISRQASAISAAKSPAPMSRQQSGTAKSPALLSRQQSAVAPKSPAPMSRQQSGAVPKSPAPVSRQQSGMKQTSKPNSPAKKNASAPADWQNAIWADFYTPKHHAYETKTHISAPPQPMANKNKPTVNAKQPNNSLKSKIPPPKSAKSPEIFSFVKATTQSGASSAAHSRQTSTQAVRVSTPAPFKKQASASSPVGNTPDVFALYMDRSPVSSKPTSRQASAKPTTPSQKYAAMKSAKPKAAPYMNLNKPIPREMSNASSEGSDTAAIKLFNDANERGIQMQPMSKQQLLQQQKQRKAKQGKKQAKQAKPAAAGNSWFTPAGIAVASAIVAIGGVGISNMMG